MSFDFRPLCGAEPDRRAVHTVGVRPFVLGLLRWVLVASAALAAILAGWIR